MVQAHLSSIISVLGKGKDLGWRSVNLGGCPVGVSKEASSWSGQWVSGRGSG